MKKRILSLILALSMVLSVLPLGAFAEGSLPELVMKNGYPVSTSGSGWSYDDSTQTLTLTSGTFDFSYINPQGKTPGTPTTTPVACAIKIESGAEITGGTFNAIVHNGEWNIPGGTISNGIFNEEVTNSNTIKNGTFNGYVENEGTIDKGTFNEDVTNSGTIKDGTFAANKEVKNYGTIKNGTFAGNVRNERTIENGTFKDSVINLGTITDGIFEGNVQNDNEGTISGGAFSSTVQNYGGTIEKGTFEGSVTNFGTIKGGTFNGKVSNRQGGSITNGTFNYTVENVGGGISNGTFTHKVENNDNGTIFGGTFAGGVNNSNNGLILGGVFNGYIDVDVPGVGVYPIAVDGASPGDKIEKVNGVSAVWDPYVVMEGNALPEVTVTASTEIYSLNYKPLSTDNCNSAHDGNENTVKFTMQKETMIIGCGGLIMTYDGYPVSSSNGNADCEGKGWSYDKNTKTLTLKSGTFDFSSTYPQNTSKGVRAEPVKCVIRSGATITGGIFAGSVTNNDGTISGGTFKVDVINKKGGTISGGSFNGKVTNNDATIYGGIFAGGVENDWRIYGGVFNGKTGLDGVTGLLSITAASGAKITEVNGVSADWKPYVVVTSYATTNEVIITADTEIFSLNGYPIDGSPYDSSYPDTTDKKTVKFTRLGMLGDGVVLNRTAELEVVGGEIKSGETAKGSGRVLIGGKVEVTTKDKNQDFVGWTIAPEGIELRDDDGREVDLTSEWTFSFMMPDVSGGKLTLTANYQPFRTSLLMNADGTVNLEHVNHETYDGNEICKGDGWNVFNRGTLILEKWTYDFQYTAPTEKTGTLEAVTCGVQNKGGTIENGVFRSLVLNEVGGTITGGTFAAGLFEMPGTTSGNVTGGVFNGKTGLTNAHHVTVTDGSLLKVNGEDPLKVDETTGTVTPGTVWDLYAYAGTTVTITADTEIFSLNGQPIGAGNCNSSYGVDKKTVTFTMPDDDVVLNRAITSTDLVMENGYPKDSNGGKNPCKGDGWEYIKNDPTNGNMLLLTGSNQTGGLFDFSTIGDGSAVECNVFVGKPTAITGGEFNGKVINNSHILGGTFHGPVDNTTMGTIEKGTFHGAVENNGIINDGAFHDAVKNNGTINDGTFHGKVENNSVINSGTFNSPVDNTTMGRIENGTFNDAVENNGTIEKGTFNGAVENNGTINGGVFNGAVTGSGTVSESITGSGTLNGEPITKTEPEPEPEPTTYTVTVIGGTIDGKTSVSAKENDTLTVVLDQSEIPDGMTFDLWSISSSKLSGDINVDYRAEAMTFQMPAEDVTIRAQYRSAEIIEDAAPSPLATAATIAVGGAAAGIVVWQGVNLGVDLYLANALPQGVPVPTDRRALALLLWETAGKPEVALPTLYGDIPTEEIELQKATRWAVQNGLMDAADKKDASFFDPDHYVTKMDVFGAWLRLKKLLGTIGTSPTQ